MTENPPTLLFVASFINWHFRPDIHVQHSANQIITMNVHQFQPRPCLAETGSPGWRNMLAVSCVLCCLQSYKMPQPSLVPYLRDSFGNGSRIDYGTGHEVSLCLPHVTHIMLTTSNMAKPWKQAQSLFSGKPDHHYNNAYMQGGSACKKSCIFSGYYLHNMAGKENGHICIAIGQAHELLQTNFVALLYCLARLGVYADGDITALVTRVFHRYLPPHAPPADHLLVHPISLLARAFVNYCLSFVGDFGLSASQGSPF